MLMRNFIKNGAKTWSNILENGFAIGPHRYICSGIPGPDKPAGTMSDVHNKMRERLGLEKGWQPIPKSRDYLTRYEPKYEELPARAMQDSFTSAIIPLSSDKALQDKYISFLGNIRLGRMLEDMDAFAVWVVHKHLLLPTLPKDVHLPYTIVTVLVDKVDFSADRGKADKDIKLSGHVSWVGKSTLEISVWLEQIDGNSTKFITKALFLMAARNATNTKALAVNPLKPANDVEKKILSGGEERKKRRQMIQATSILKIEPNDSEETLMYNIFKRTTDANSMELNKRILPPDCRWMSESYAVSTIASFPEHRNAQNTVFGGFLMRCALEISWVAGYIYCKRRPKTRHLCDISFERPVSIHSILKMISYVVYTEANFITIMTVIDIIDIVGSLQTTSNVIFTVLEAPEKVPEVLPRSYQETMWYIQGRRKFKYSLGLKDDEQLQNV